MLYGLSAYDVHRLRELLLAYERGRIRLDVPPQQALLAHQQDTYLCHTASTIGAGDTGTGDLVTLDTSIPPVATTTSLAMTVYNSTSATLPVGTYLVAREPSQGYYVPVVSGTTISYLTSTNGSTTLSSSWGNSSMNVALTANSTWLLQAQLQATITSATSGDTISCRYYDGSTQYGQTVEFCDALCATSFVDAASLTTIVTVGGTGITVYVQGVVNTSTSSTGTLNAGELVAIQIG